jgi:hypothetical protein
MLKNIITKLNFSVDIQELIDYYNILKTKYSHLDWSYDRCSDTIIEQWKDAAYADPANLLTHGWAIQSNLKDLSIPCPPWDISTLETTEYRNTELAFGIIERLQQAIPHGHRWSVSVQPNGGIVSLHSDESDEMTVWIPICTDGPIITFVNDGDQIEYCLPSDGGAYLLDTNIPHFTQNKSPKDRVTIIFRINLKHIDDLLSVEGVI